MSENKPVVSMSSFLTQDTTKNYLQKMLGDRTNQFVTSLASMVGSNEALNKCDRNSVLGCALKAVGMNLPFDQNLGFAYAIPYGTQAQFQMGYKGFIQLGLRSSQIVQLGVREVKEGEYAGRDFVGDPIINWLSDDERIDKPTIGYMAGLKLVNGFLKTTYWTIKQVESHRDKYSQSYKSAVKYGKNDAVWITNFDGMAKKTVLKELISKYAPMSTEMQEAIKIDQAVVLTNPETEEETVIYADNIQAEVNAVETISKDQIVELAKLIGDSSAKCDVFLKRGYQSINDITIEDYEDIKKEIKSIK
jgi:recombination protein RecT